MSILLRCDSAMRWDCRTTILLSCTHFKPHLGSATPRQLPRSLTCCVPCFKARQTRSRLKLPSLVIPSVLKSHEAYKPRTTQNLSGSSMTRAGAGFASRMAQASPHKESSSFSPVHQMRQSSRSLRRTRGSLGFMIQMRLAGKYNKQIVS